MAGRGRDIDAGGEGEQSAWLCGAACVPEAGALRSGGWRLLFWRETRRDSALWPLHVQPRFVMHCCVLNLGLILVLVVFCFLKEILFCLRHALMRAKFGFFYFHFVCFSAGKFAILHNEEIFPVFAL